MQHRNFTHKFEFPFFLQLFVMCIMVIVVICCLGLLKTDSGSKEGFFCPRLQHVYFKCAPKTSCLRAGCNFVTGKKETPLIMVLKTLPPLEQLEGKPFPTKVAIVYLVP